MLCSPIQRAGRARFKVKLFLQHKFMVQVLPVYHFGNHLPASNVAVYGNAPQTSGDDGSANCTPFLTPN